LNLARGTLKRVFARFRSIRIAVRYLRQARGTLKRGFSRFRSMRNGYRYLSGSRFPEAASDGLSFGKKYIYFSPYKFSDRMFLRKNSAIQALF
jgi:hypothetical protein